MGIFFGNYEWFTFWLTLQTGISRSIILKAQCITTFEPQEPSPWSPSCSHDKASGSKGGSKNQGAPQFSFGQPSRRCCRRSCGGADLLPFRNRASPKAPKRRFPGKADCLAEGREKSTRVHRSRAG